MEKPHTDDVRRGLAEAGQRLAQARRDHQAAIADIAEWLRRGVPDALPLSEAARLARITRRTAYRLLQPHGGPGRREEQQ